MIEIARSSRDEVLTGMRKFTADEVATLALRRNRIDRRVSTPSLTTAPSASHDCPVPSPH